MDEIYPEVFYDKRKNLYVMVDIDYSKINGDTIEEKIKNMTYFTDNKLDLCYCERGRDRLDFCLPKCIALIPNKAHMIKLIADDDFYEEININRLMLLADTLNKKLLFDTINEKETLYTIQVPSIDSHKVFLPNDKITSDFASKEVKKGYLSRADKKKLKKNKKNK